MPCKCFSTHSIQDFMGFHFLKKCDDTWECNEGPCTANEKALRSCLANMARELYPCSYYKGKPEWGATTNMEKTWQGTCIILSLFLGLFLSALWLLWDTDEADKHILDLEHLSYALAMFVWGAMLTYLFRRAMTHPPKPHLPKVVDLKGPCTTGDLHMCAAPSAEAPPWNYVVPPIVRFAVVSFQYVSVLCVVCFLSVIIRWKVRELLSLSRFQEDVQETTPLVQP